MIFICCKDARRTDVQAHPTLNGIDFLEVLDDKAMPVAERQTTLFLHLLKPIPADAILKVNVLIKGGDRIKNIGIVSVLPVLDSPVASPPGGSTKEWAVKVTESGDFSIYTLCLVQDNKLESPVPFAGFDQVMACVDFSFKVACEKDFDCKPALDCPPESPELPDINYLAKDYASFRQLMFDRIALLAPSWKERNPADLGVVLVELLAYTADYLSYKQDAVATEAYLGTARKRSSVRRHARLVDYFMHDGCNARTWIQIRVEDPLLITKFDNNELPLTRILSKIQDMPAFLSAEQAQFAILNGAQVFEPLHNCDLFPEHNEMYFHTWGSESCCLPKGATHATLTGHFRSLKINDILILAEKCDPETGVEADADSHKRHPIKITKIVSLYDGLYADGANPLGLPITEIHWHTQDALPFPLCINSETIEHIGVAWGNILLADHGLTLNDHKGPSSLFPDTVPEIRLSYTPDSDGSFCEDKKTENLPLRYRPYLKQVPLTQAAAFDRAKSPSALGDMTWDMRTVMPTIRLIDHANIPWKPERDLLNAGVNSKNFVVETESDGISYFRFGNGEQGELPETGEQFKAIYRIGNGKKGNLGANSLLHIYTTDPNLVTAGDSIKKVWNPLSAKGGTEAESMESVRQYAPEAFRTQLRAVTNADYEYFAQKVNPEVQRAAATLRWTGSWRTVFLTIDRFNGLDIDPPFENVLRSDLEAYRMAGFDLEVDGPLYVNLEIVINACIKPGFRVGDVKNALFEVLSNRVLYNGSKGVFHPDNFTFGQPVYLSRLYAAAQSVDGISSINIVTLRKQGDTINTVPETGVFTLGRREIARCDNDPNFPERGVIKINIKNNA
jgi:hypothetical protein